MSEFDAHQELANIAHGVDSPFIRGCRNSKDQGRIISGIVARDVGENAAANVIFWGHQVATDFNLLETILDTAKAKYSSDNPHLQRFLNDEFAVLHAIIVYKTCTDAIEPVS